MCVSEWEWEREREWGRERARERETAFITTQHFLSVIFHNTSRYRQAQAPLVVHTHRHTHTHPDTHSTLRTASVSSRTHTHLKTHRQLLVEQQQQEDEEQPVLEVRTSLRVCVCVCVCVCVYVFACACVCMRMSGLRVRMVRKDSALLLVASSMWCLRLSVWLPVGGRRGCVPTGAAVTLATRRKKNVVFWYRMAEARSPDQASSLSPLQNKIWVEWIWPHLAVDFCC